MRFFWVGGKNTNLVKNFTEHLKLFRDQEGIKCFNKVQGKASNQLSNILISWI